MAESPASDAVYSEHRTPYTSCRSTCHTSGAKSWKCTPGASSWELTSVKSAGASCGLCLARGDAADPGRSARSAETARRVRVGVFGGVSVVRQGGSRADMLRGGDAVGGHASWLRGSRSRSGDEQPLGGEATPCIGWAAAWADEVTGLTGLTGGAAVAPRGGGAWRGGDAGRCRLGVTARPGGRRGAAGGATASCSGASSAASAARRAASSSLHLAPVSILRVEVTTPTMV